MASSPEFAAWFGGRPPAALGAVCAAWGEERQLGRWRVWCQAPRPSAFSVGHCRTPFDEPSEAKLAADGGSFSRAVGGGAPIHFAVCDDGILLSSRVSAFTVGLGLTRPNALATAMWFAGSPTFPQRQTPIEGIRSLRPGERLRLSADGKLLVEPWYLPPDAPPGPPSVREFELHAQALAEELQAIVQRECEEEKTLVFYSGGVDSGLLAAIAIQRNKHPSALSFVPKRFAANAARERAMVEQRALTEGFSQHQIVELNQRDWMDKIRASRPSPFPVVYHASLWLEDVARQVPVSTVLRGEFADETFGSHLRLPDYLATFRLCRGLQTGPSRWPLGLRTPLSAWRFRAARRLGRPLSAASLELPPCFREDLRRQYRALQVDFIATHRGLALFDRRDGILTEAWESAGALGIHTVFPFMHRRVLDLAYRLHPSELLDQSTKRLLRAAGRGIALETHRLRADKGWTRPPSRHRSYELPKLSAEARNLLCPRWLAEATTCGVGPQDALRLTGLEHMIQSCERATRDFEA